ncbi:DUF2634 domain-containing protein [Deinococcus sp. PEB2-67]
MIAQDVVQPGETIVGLSSRLTGSPDNWRTLAQLNSLRAPYVAAQASPGVLGPGSVILYHSSVQTVTPTNAAELEALTYKRDLTLSGGDLVLSGGTPVIAVGLSNLERALTRRLRHALGSHPFHPTTWGSLLRTHVGSVADEARIALIETDARRALLADPRVALVEVSGEWSDDLLDLTCTVTPIPPGSAFTFEVRI